MDIRIYSTLTCFSNISQCNQNIIVRCSVEAKRVPGCHGHWILPSGHWILRSSGPAGHWTFWSKPLKLHEPVAQMTKMSEKKDAISEIVTPWTETTIQLTLASGRGNSEMNWPFLAFLCWSRWARSAQISVSVGTCFTIWLNQLLKLQPFHPYVALYQAVDIGIIWLHIS